MIKKEIPLIRYIEWLENKQYFSILKWGDGEWAAVFSSRGTWIGSNQARSPALQKDLQQSLLRSLKFKHPKSRILFAAPDHIKAGQVEQYCHRQKLRIPWVQANTFYHASSNGELFPLIEILRQKKVVVVGPAFLKCLLERTFQYADFVEIPPAQCYGVKQRTLDTIRRIRSKFGNNVVYSFSAGPAAEVFISALVPEMPENFLIDFGSLWDIFCGRRTRGYTKGRRYPESTLNQNLGLTEKENEK